MPQQPPDQQTLVASQFGRRADAYVASEPDGSVTLGSMTMEAWPS